MMKSEECEAIMISLMARLDGESSMLSEELTAEHLLGCQSCRSELEQQQAAAALLLRQKRQPVSASLWPEIAHKLSDQAVARPVLRRNFFFLLGAVLLGYKLVEMIPARDLGFLFKLVPLLLIAALFYLYKENPFKINTELRLEGDPQ
jgi:predicted anti-sigma-YlaC factor YlaD